MKHTKINDASVDSYKKLQDNNTITLRQTQVLAAINRLGKATNRMIAKELDWDINRVTGRVTELRDKDLVTSAGVFFDAQTNRTVNLWKCN